MPNNGIVQNLIRRQNGIETSEKFQLKLFKNRLSIGKNLFKRDLISHYGCVNAIEFSKEGNFLISGKSRSRMINYAYLHSLPCRNECLCQKIKMLNPHIILRQWYMTL